MRKISLMVSVLLISSCTSLPESNMGNAAAWCAEIEVTGRFTSTDAQGRYLGVSDSALLAGATVADILQLIDRLCVE